MAEAEQEQLEEEEKLDSIAEAQLPTIVHVAAVRARQVETADENGPQDTDRVFQSRPAVAVRVAAAEERLPAHIGLARCRRAEQGPGLSASRRSQDLVGLQRAEC